MTIDPNQPVTLKRHALVKGTFYHPRDYNPGELPAELLSDEYVSQDTSDIPTFSPFAGSFEETTITIGVDAPNSEQASFTTSTVILTPDNSRLQINSATIEAIADLEGVSLTVARKVVEERLKTPFTGIDDLKSRVPLPKNVKWETFTDKLMFDAPIVEQTINESSTSSTIQP